MFNKINSVFLRRILIFVFLILFFYVVFFGFYIFGKIFEFIYLNLMYFLIPALILFFLLKLNKSPANIPDSEVINVQRVRVLSEVIVLDSYITNEDEEKIRIVVKNVYDVIYKTKAKEPTFEELIVHFINYGGIDVAVKQFNAYKLGWELNNFERTNYNEVFMKFFRDYVY